MKKVALLTTVSLLAACATQPPPAAPVAYTPAVQMIEPRPVAITPPTEEKPKKQYKTAAAALAAAAKGCKRNALDAEFEGSIATYRYERGACYELVLHAPSGLGEPDANASLLFLDPRDGEPEVGFSDETYFSAEKTTGGLAEMSMRQRRDLANSSGGGMQVILPLKCWKPGAKTTAFVTTQSRTYQFRVNCNWSRGAPYNEAVQFTFADQKPEPEQQPTRALPVVIDDRYMADGAQDLLPGQWKAFHDGARMHIFPPGHIQSRPVPFVPGTDQAPRYRVDPSGKYVIEGLFPEVRFMFGGEVLTVKKVSS